MGWLIFLIIVVLVAVFLLGYITCGLLSHNSEIEENYYMNLDEYKIFNEHSLEKKAESKLNEDKEV